MNLPQLARYILTEATSIQEEGRLLAQKAERLFRMVNRDLLPALEKPHPELTIRVGNIYEHKESGQKYILTRIPEQDKNSYGLVRLSSKQWSNTTGSVYGGTTYSTMQLAFMGRQNDFKLGEPL